MPQPDDDRPGQGGKVDDAGGFETVLRVPKHIGQHQPPLGIGVDDLDRVALHRGHDIARPLRAPVRHVLHQTDEANDVRLRLAQRQRAHDARDDASAAHVHRHLFHPARGLDGDAAGVEDHALADEGKGRIALLAAHPLHDDHLGGAFRPLPNAQKCPHAKLFQIGLFQHLDLQAKLRHVFQPCGEFGRGQDVGGFVDQIAGETDALGQRQRGGGLGPGRVGIGGKDHRLAARGLVTRLVRGEVIGAQGQPQRDLRQPLLPLGQNRDAGLPHRLADGGAGLARLLHIGAARQLHQMQRLGLQPGGPGKVHPLARFQLCPALARHRPPDRAPAETIKPA